MTSNNEDVMASSVKTDSEVNKVTWKIYYGDKSTFDSSQGGPEDAPALNAQIIVQPDPDVGWYTTHSRDYYVWQYNRWTGVDKFGLYYYLSLPGWKRVLFGVTLLTSDFNEIYKRAKADKNFANKAGWLPRELRPEELG